eukprot:9845002-Lingulodinium_polyedra.AAC.1
MDRQGMRGFWHLALNGGFGFQLPRREMHVVSSKVWATMRYQQQGKCLEGFYCKCEWVDRECSAGVSQLCCRHRLQSSS